MAIDSSIAMGVQPMKIDSPMNALAQMMQIKHAQQKTQLGELTMQDHQRTYDDTNKLNQAYTGALGADGSIDRNKLFSLVAQSNLGSKIPGLQKGFMETDKATGEVDAQKFKLASDRHATFQKTLASLAQEPGLSKDMVTQAGQSLVQQGLLPADLYQKAMADMPDDPAQLRARIIRAGKSQMTPEQIFTVFAPKPEKIDNGGQISFMDTNPNSPTYGKPTGGAAVAKVQSPDNIATTGAARANAAATLGAAGMKVDRDTEMKLADDYRAQSKLFGESVSAHKQLTATLGSATTSPAATLAAATKFMKILDPGSVVRESELGMALQASGVLDRAQNYINILQKGKVLTKTQAADFQTVSQQMFEAAQQVQQTIDADYTSKANGYKVRPDMIVQDLGQNARAPGKAPPIKDKAAFDALPSGATFTAPDGSVRRKP